MPRGGRRERQPGIGRDAGRCALGWVQRLTGKPRYRRLGDCEEDASPIGA